MRSWRGTNLPIDTNAGPTDMEAPIPHQQLSSSKTFTRPFFSHMAHTMLQQSKTMRFHAKPAPARHWIMVQS